MISDLTEKQEQIFTLMEQYGRIKGEEVVEEVDGIEYKQLAHYHLSELVDKGYATRVNRGLYELADGPDIDPSEFEFASSTSSGDNV